MKKVTSYKLQVTRKDKSKKLATCHLPRATSRGFTLIEMLVSLALFMVVAVIAVTALLKIVDANRKSQTLQDTVNNINFAMDSITRELRVGSAYTCGSLSGANVYRGPIPQTSQGTSCSTINSNNAQDSGTYIAFLSSNTTKDHSGNPCNLTYAYYFQPVASTNNTYTWTIEKAQQSQTPTGYCADSLGTSDPYFPIIDPSIVITSYTIKVVANDTGQTVQPSVFLYISGYTGNDVNTRSYFDIQTTISERN